MMKRYAWLLAIAGWLCFLLAAFAHYRGGSHRLSVTRSGLHAKAVQAVREALAWDAAAWPWHLTTHTNRQLALWEDDLRRTGRPEWLRTPLVARITLKEHRGREVRVELGMDGRLVGMRAIYPRRTETPPLPIEAQDAIANRLFHLMAAGTSLRPGTVKSDGDVRRHLHSTPDSRWDLEIKVNQRGLDDAAIRPVIPNRGAYSRRANLDQWLNAPSVLLAPFAVITSVFLYLVGWFRGVMEHRSALVVAVLFAAIALIEPLLTGRAFEGEDAMRALGLLAMVALATGTGMTEARRLVVPRWWGFILFARLKWNTKAVGASVAAGILWAGWVGVWGLLARWIPGALVVESARSQDILSRMPALVWWYPLVPTALFLLFVVGMPVCWRWFHKKGDPYVFLPAAMLALLGSSPFTAGVVAVLVWTVLTVATLYLIYRVAGVLAVLVAGKVAAAAAYAAFAAFSAPGAGLAAAILLQLGTAAVAALVLARFGRDSVQEPEKKMRDAFLSEGEKLKHEFNLAQQAQQRLLPAAMPHLPGFTVAASCQPATEVGGDLWDHFPLRGGRTGLCVADVSGKGMPAALYMTLTKGLLAAAVPSSTDLLEIAVHLNRHLYTACKRKMFVTAVLAALDPATRRLELLRAGHNPVLVKKADTGEAAFWNPPGLGLGLAGPALFERGTKVEHIELNQGDVVVMYSDGVTEAMNEHQEQYGEERLKAVVQRSDASAPGVHAAIQQDLAAFVGSEPPHDDVTIVVLAA